MAVDNKTLFESALLRRLHSLLLQIDDLEGQLDRGPRQIKAGESILDSCRDAVEAAKQNVKDATIACDEKQLQLKTREDRIEGLKAKLNTAASNKEFDLLKEQIAADQQANSVQSDEILEGLERIDELNDAVTAAEKDLAEKTTEHKKRVESVENRMAVVQADLDHVRNELVKAEAEIPAAARSEYKRLIEGRGDEALAPIEDDSCGGCHQTLTTQMVDRVRLGYLTHCPACSAWLYST
ncbi:Putative zinc ribbon domain protein [Stieleria maiorica]|uniref:Zinc ribbon domain protein n=1 Tax=Stieleria maiorica TaxID=2795974 RepID=A0A5B9MH50_9BACT|nr:phospholipase [Stieleria maiorica]QEF99829.1 Putative zinc ribbon domain protein [Stieleria maiorica]